MSDELPEVLTVLGKLCDSKEEYWIGEALTRMKRKFRYQVSFMGGNMAGGRIFDFVIDDRPPLPIPLEIDGARWHDGKRKYEDDVQEYLSEGEMNGKYAKSVHIKAEEITSIETAMQIIRKKKI
jgi:hypothetical protein